MATISYDPSGVFLPSKAASAAASWPKLGRGLPPRATKCWPTRNCGPAAAMSRARSSRSMPAFTSCPIGCWPNCANKAATAKWRRLRAAADRLARAGRHAWWCSESAARTWGRGHCSRLAATSTTTRSSRLMRRGRPRMYFEGNNVDNDALLGSGAAAGEPRRSLGHRRHQQERRHAGNGRRVSHPAARTARHAGQAGQANWRAGRSGDRHDRASCSSWPRRLAVATCFRCPTAWAGGFRCCRRWACCRPRCWGSTSRSCCAAPPR